MSGVRNNPYSRLDDPPSYGDMGRESLIPELKENEKKIFDQVKSGDIIKAASMLDNDPDFDINTVDGLGQSVLHIAVKNKDVPMVEILLKRPHIDVGDCLQHAVQLDHPKIVEMLLDKLKRYNKINPAIQPFGPCFNSPDFPDRTTPMMVAAQNGLQEMIGLLRQLGEDYIPPPHQPRCMCGECRISLEQEDPLALAAYKLDVYSAVCNPAYLSVTSEDPILTAFYLVIDLREAAYLDRVFYRRYETLIEETEIFAADLISQCRSSDEVKIMLNAKEGTSLRADYIFPRLMLAVDLRQKQFVAQTNIQAVLEETWIGDWYEWRSFSEIRKTVIFLGRILMLPVLFVVCTIMPSFSWAKFYSIPLNRMISSVASYFIFLSLLFYESDRDKKDQTRYQITSHFRVLVLIWIYMASYILNSLRLWAVQGTKRFFAFKWNIYDLATELMLTLAFLFWLCGLITVHWLPDLERKYWHYLDPQLLSEGFFCVGTVMAYARLLLLVQIHPQLGPMQVSLGKMTKDCSQFIIIFAIVIGSFNVGLCRLYNYYDEMKQVDPETKAESRQESSFVSVLDTFRVLFWGMFCMSSQDAARVVIENLPAEGGELETINNHDFTEAVGFILFGVFTVLSVIVLLNMLIAAMSNTFTKVTENVDVEWIFGRTEVYLAYMAQTVLPPPANFVCAGVGHNGCSDFFLNIIHRLTKKEEDATLPRVSNEEPWDRQTKTSLMTAAYKELVVKLVQRYFSEKREEKRKGDMELTERLSAS